MERIENVKKKHHFVFQAYLSKWKENNAVWVLRDRKKLFPTGTEAIAFKIEAVMLALFLPFIL